MIMTRKRAELAAAVLAAVFVLGLAIRSSAASSSHRPKPSRKIVLSATGTGPTFVEGARPTADANPATGEGCVQYSPQRPDVHICSTNGMPADWAPDPAPYFDRSICAQSAQWVNDPSNVANATAHFLDLEGTGPVDVSTCEIVATHSSSSMDVVFVRNGGADNVHVEYQP
jgi:hypothetical protein